MRERQIDSVSILFRVVHANRPRKPQVKVKSRGRVARDHTVLTQGPGSGFPGCLCGLNALAWRTVLKAR